MANKRNTFYKLLSRIDPEGSFGCCWEWTGNCLINALPYGRFKMGGKTYLTHRLVYSFYYNDQLSSLDIVMHLCDNPKCLNPLHLKKGTTYDNVQDKMKKGRFSNGIKKIKDNQLKDTQLIVSLYKQGLSIQQVANKLKCHRNTVRNHLLRSGLAKSS